MFSIGDRVIVRPVEEIRQTLRGDNKAILESGTLYFNPQMEKFCGKAFTISDMYGVDDIILKDHNDWTFCRAWLRPEILDNRRIHNV